VENGYAAFLAGFTREAVTKQWIEYYHRLMAARQAKGTALAHAAR
jgi:hypothetical protein